MSSKSVSASDGRILTLATSLDISRALKTTIYTLIKS
jgi:hypothetical protein